MDQPNGSGRNHAVLAFLFREDNSSMDDALMQEIVTHFNATNTQYKMNFAQDFYSSIKDNVITDFHYYQGSNTKPPCSETYNWYVADNPILIKTELLQPFRDKYINSGIDVNSG